MDIVNLMMQNSKNSPLDYLEDKHFRVDTHILVLQDTLRPKAKKIYDNTTLINEAIAIIKLKSSTINRQLKLLNLLKDRTLAYQKNSILADNEIYKILSEIDLLAKNLDYRGAKLLSTDLVSNRLHFDRLQSKSTTIDNSGFITLNSTKEIATSGKAKLIFDLVTESIEIDDVEFGIDRYGIKELASMIEESIDILEATWQVCIYSTQQLSNTNVKNLSVNGIYIGNIDTNLVSTINSYTNQTGVKATIDDDYLLLESDGRGIEIYGDIENLHLNCRQNYGVLHLKSYTKEPIRFKDIYKRVMIEDGFRYNLADVFSELLRKDDDGFSKDELKDFAIESIESAQAHLLEYLRLMDRDKEIFIEALEKFVDEINRQREKFYHIHSDTNYSNFDISLLNKNLFANAHNGDSLEGISPKILLDTNYEMFPIDTNYRDDLYIRSKKANISSNIDIKKVDYFNFKQKI
jgi:hypothetical protein